MLKPPLTVRVLRIANPQEVAYKASNRDTIKNKGSS